MLIIEVEGSEAEIDDLLRASSRIAGARAPKTIKVSQVGGRERGDLEGPQVRLRRHGPRRRLYLHGRHHPDGPAALRAAADRRDREEPTGLRVANVFHAGDGNLHPLVLYNVNDPGERRRRRTAGDDILKLCVEVGGCLTGEHGVGIEKRDLMTLPVQRRPTSSSRCGCARVFDPAGCSTRPRSFRSRAGFSASGIVDGRAAAMTRPHPRDEADAVTPSFSTPPRGGRR